MAAAIKLEACKKAVVMLHERIYPEWGALGYLLSAITGLELGDQLQNAHLQHGAIVATLTKYTSENDMLAVKEHVEALRNAFLASTHEGRITWQFRIVRRAHERASTSAARRPLTARPP